jgi:hypothetical protein
MTKQRLVRLWRRGGGRLRPGVRFWRNGANRPPSGSVHVSMNDFLISRAPDRPRVALAGLRFWRAWSDTEGALGLWYAGSPGGRRQISVSVWRESEDLRRFVRTPAHLKVMRDFRGAGVLHTNAWTAERLDYSLIWQQAEDRLMGRVVGVSHN